MEAVFNSAFEGTQNLSHVTIPDSVTILATYAFSNSSLTSVIIGNGIEEILLSVFENCTNLKNVQFGSGLIRIWDSAFRFCSNLESIVIPEGVTSIGSGVFMNCTKLVNITIPDSVTSIGRYAFSGCSSLTSITIPGNATSIGSHAFLGCENLASVTFEDSEGWYRAQTEGATDGTELASEDLSDPSTAAEYLTDTYGDCYWYKR